MASVSSLREGNLSDAANSAARKLGYESGLKKEQLEVVVSFLAGRDVFAVLPTGFGKSLCYACLPFAFEFLERRSEKPVVVVVTPLTAIMKDQEKSFRARGLKVAYVAGEIDDEVRRNVQSGFYQLVFFTPELIIDNKRWRKVLSSSIYLQRLRGFVIDEAHCIAKWGYSFRCSLQRIGEVRSILPVNVRVMALTATASSLLRHIVSKIIGLQNPYYLSSNPCKKNLAYAVGKFTTTAETFHPMVNKLSTLRSEMPRVIIYCRRFEDCSNIYIMFKNELGISFTEPPSAPDITKFRLVEMFTSVTDDYIKEEIIELFTRTSQLRIVIATIAFGMGIDCSDVREVVHVDAPDDVEAYIQETGRAGRDGQAALAMLLLTNSKRQKREESMLKYMDNVTECRRDKLFENMESYEHVNLGSKCLCCDICGKKCACGMCDLKTTYFTYLM